MKQNKVFLAFSLVLLYVCCIVYFAKANSDDMSKHSTKSSICEDKTIPPPVKINSYTPARYHASLGLNTLS